MDDQTKSRMSTIYGILAIPAILVGLYGAYYVFTYKPPPRQPEPKVESFRAEQKDESTSGPEVKIKQVKPKPGEPKVWHVNLVWEVSNADEVTIDNGIGKVDPKGEREVAIEKTTTFVMKAKNKTGEITYNLDVELPE